VRSSRCARAVVALAMAAALAACSATSTGSSPEPTGSTGPSSSSAPPKPLGAVFTHPSIAQNAMAGATAALTKLATYSYKSFDSDIKAAEADMTPSYAARYAAKAPGLKATVVRLKNTSTASKVVVGVVSIDESLESGTVLAGFTQTTTGTTYPPRTVTKVVALVGMIELNQKWLVNSLAIPPAGPPAPGDFSLGSQDLTTALASGESEITTLGTLSKAHFHSDYTKWLSVTTGALKKKLTKAESTTKSAIAHSAVKLTTICKAAAVESASGTKVELLVYVTATGKHSTSNLSRMTVENIDGHWLAESLTEL
jgi:hypothetical protein